LLFGALCGWMIGYITFGIISFCFAIAFWAAGRETGSQVRAGNKELAFTCILPFLGGLTLGTVALYFYSGEITSFVALAMNVGAMAFGFILGKCGFG
jgi:hypothetical protein